MANPVGFEGANAVLLAPPNDDECRDLEIMRYDDQVISCWRLTDEELARVNETGVVWFTCHGHTHPPISITGSDIIALEGRPAKAEPYVPPPRKRGE